MRDEQVLAQFYERSTSAPVDWRAGFVAWAQIAVARAAELEACQPEEHEVLLKATRDLLLAVESRAQGSPEIARGRISILSGFVHASACCLQDRLIPEWETQAHEAARDLREATLSLLLALDDDYGDVGPD
jgi:hypothetical protein